MERRNFLKKLFGIGVGAAAMATVPALSKPKDAEFFTLEDLFDRCDGNSSMYFLKEDSWLNNELKKAMGDRYVSRKYFSYYYPLNNLFLPVKEKYTRDDFEPIFLFLKSKKFDYWCSDMHHGKDNGVMRIIRDRKEDFYHIDFYNCRNPKSDSNY